MKKAIVTLSFPFVLFLIAGCCDCAETIFFKYRTCALQLESLDNASQEPVVSTSQEVIKEAFGLRATISRKEDQCWRRPSSFLPMAYAMGCICPPEMIFEPVETAQSIQIRTISDFDVEHPAGADVSDKFSVWTGQAFISLVDFTKEVTGNIDFEFQNTFQFDLMLMLPPPNSGTYQFEVIIDLSDGRELQEQSAIINLI